MRRERGVASRQRVAFDVREADRDAVAVVWRPDEVRRIIFIYLAAEVDGDVMSK
jgi:hypothetical protein